MKQIICILGAMISPWVAAIAVLSIGALQLSLPVDWDAASRSMLAISSIVCGICAYLVTKDD